MSYQIQDGKAIIEPFKIKVDGIPAEISGETALLTQEIDYTMKMDLPLNRIPEGVAGQAASLIDQLNNVAGTNFSTGDSIPINIRFTGTIEKPTIGTNYGDVSRNTKENVREEIKEAVKEQTKEVIEDVKEDAKAAGQAEADKIMAEAQHEAGKLIADAKKAADQGKDLAYKEAKKLENDAKGPVAKAAARLAADKIRKETDAAHLKAMDEAKKQSEKILAEAKKKADKKIDSIE